jgi:hypothetical protein
VNGPALVSRLRSLSPAEAFTVVGAIERAWTSSEYRIKDVGEKIYLVNLAQKEVKQN